MQQERLCKILRSMRKKWVTTVVSACIIAILLYTGRDKLMNFPLTKLQMSESPWSLISKNNYFFAWAVPLVELVVCIMLIWLPFRKWGFIISLCLFASFSIYILTLMAFAQHLPCSCGGIISELSWSQHLVVNLVFGVLSYWGFSNELHYEKRQRQMQAREMII